MVLPFAGAQAICGRLLAVVVGEGVADLKL